MGVPGFYKWLFEAYGSNLQTEMKQSRVYSQNKNDTPAGKFDNLYIDMNGVIHPAFHPRSGKTPETYEEVFTRLFLYLDRLMNVIQPRKVLFLSIDGPAPRAKMNQQRYRRFRSVVDLSRSNLIASEMMDVLVNKLKHKIANDKLDANTESALSDMIQELTSPMDAEEGFKKDNLSDSNIITPGTDFMAQLSKAVIYYVTFRMSSDPKWKNITVLVSDSSVPGEGEQKIFDFVREMRQFDGYDPNTSHVIHGLDADLVMLSLLTHEPNFFILREDVFDRHTVDLEKPLGLFQIRPLRVKLAQTFHPLITQLNMNLERIINDFIFVLYFMGNDFIPQIASIDINDSISHVCNEYIDYQMECEENKREYFTEPHGNINLPRVIHFIRKRLLPYENAIMKLRLFNWSMNSSHHTVTDYETPRKDVRRFAGEEFVGQFVKQGLATKPQDAPKVFKSVASDLKEKIEKKVFHMPRNQVFPREVLNAEKGWEEKYYKIKYRCDPTTDTATLTELRRNVAIEFLRGVVWVWKYYTLTDTPSWSWFYPHHFGPLFADFDLVQPSDLQGLIEFSYDAPFAPFDQLFAVLPSKSLTALPKVYQDLSEDKELKEYFPKRFEIDLNGHELIHSFKAVPLLPFMDQNLLMKHTRKAAKSLTPDEKKRNSFGHTVAFFRKRHKPLNKMLETTEFKKSTLGPNDSPSPPDKSLFVNHIKYNIAGFLYNLSENHPMRSIVPKRKQKVESPFGDQMLFPSFKNDTFSAIYILPQTPEKKKKYGILPGFDFDKTPKLASSWFGNDLRTPESMYRDLIQPVTKKPEKPQAVVIKEDDTSESSEEMHDEMESAVKEVEAESKEAQNELVNEDNDEMKITTEDILERVMQKQDAKQQKGGRRRKFKKAHGNHKIALNKEHPLARSGETPARFAFCEKTQTFPRPVFEKQAEYESKQNVIAEKKRIQKQQKGAKRRRTKDEQLEFKVRHREKSGGRPSKKRKVT